MLAKPLHLTGVLATPRFRGGKQVIITKGPFGVETWACEGHTPKSVHISLRRHPICTEKIKSKLNERDRTCCQKGWWPREE